MTEIRADERVRLTRDLPEHGLRRGDKGVVCSTWCDPRTVFEVEFQTHNPGFPIRTLLKRNQIQKDTKSRG